MLREHWLVLLLLAAFVTVVAAQDEDAPPPAPPRYLLLVHQQTSPGKTGERQRLETASAQAFERFNVPIYWIAAEALTGRPHALFLDPFESFDELEKALPQLARLHAQHPEVAKLKEGVDDLLVDTRTMVAVRRDDLTRGTADLSKAHFLRVTIVQGTADVVQDFNECNCAVYELTAGTSLPAFAVVHTMPSLGDEEDVLGRRQGRESPSEGEKRTVSTSSAPFQSDLYVISPGMSHVPADLAAGDPGFWKQKATPPAVPSSAPPPSTPKPGRK